MSARQYHDVVIAGAGPVGLFLAGELALAGCSVMVLEQAADPHSPLKALPFGLRGLSVPTLDSLDRRGLLDAVREEAVGRDAPGAHWMRQRRRPAGHFAGIQFFADQVDFGRQAYRLPGEVASVAVTMARLEALLAERAASLGVEIRRGCGVEGFEARDDGIAIHAGDDRISAGWLVGCDGGRSRVRKAAGIAFVGTEPEFTGYSAEIVLADPDRLPPGRHYTATGMYTFTPPGTIAMVDFDGGAHHRADPVTREHVEAVLRRVSGVDLDVDALTLATTWTDRAFQAERYQSGRVLLAGDAAHVHSPLGGQGLNLGLGDAMNLGWKLAATIRGDAPADLLDSYERERHPIGAQILDWSRAQVALMRPSPSTRALEAIMRDLIATGDGATYFAERVLGLTLRHDLGDGHPLVGRSAPDLALGDGTRINACLRGGRGLLVDLEASAARDAIAARWASRVDHVVADADVPLGLGAMLVRPDGDVAWASDRGAGDGGLEDALARWFGSGAC